MARIRTVKPEFFRHFDLYHIEKESGLPIRLAFLGLLTVADREGRFKWRPESLKVEVLPFDGVDFEECLDLLVDAGFLHKYAVGNCLYGTIPTFKRHQVINNRERDSELPAPEEGVEIRPDRSRHIPSDVKRTVWATRRHACANCKSTRQLVLDHVVPWSKGGEHTVENLQILCDKCNALKSDSLYDSGHASSRVVEVEKGKGREGKGKEGKGKVSRASTRPASVFLDLESFTWKNITPADRDIWAKSYPQVNLDQELARAADWIRSNPSRKKSNWRAYLTRWFARVQDRPPKSGDEWETYKRQVAERGKHDRGPV